MGSHVQRLFAQLPYSCRHLACITETCGRAANDVAATHNIMIQHSLSTQFSGRAYHIVIAKESAPINAVRHNVILHAASACQDPIP
eukprot:scaffold181802_cov18-Tisochrysis_lutea.AAC.2